MKIDWKVRFSNPAFWIHVAISFFIPIFTHFGYNWAQMTSWPMLFSVLADAFRNPVIVVGVFVSVWNCIFDPTTKGMSDCQIKLGALSNTTSSADSTTETA